MKKLLFCRLFGIVVINLCMSNSYAQQNADHNYLASASSAFVLLNNASPSFSSLSNPTDALKVSPKALHSFMQLYQKAEFTNWTKSNRNYLITFSQENKKYRVLMGKNGNLIYSICYIQEKDMPVDIRKMVKTVYYDYTINLAMQVNQDNRTIWIILIQDSNRYLTLRIENDDMDEVSQMDKVK